MHLLQVKFLLLYTPGVQHITGRQLAPVVIVRFTTLIPTISTKPMQERSLIIKLCMNIELKVRYGNTRYL